MICGLKLSHDGGLAVVDGDKLLVCVEAEKVGNAPRYSSLRSLDAISGYLEDLGLALDELNVSVDGWVLQQGGGTAVDVELAGQSYRMPVAGYDERRDPRLAGCPLKPVTGQFPGLETPFRSFAHATGHLMSAYCTSPAAKVTEPSLVLVWDGGMPACLYRVDPRSRVIRPYGAVLDISGAIYPLFASLFNPFAIPPNSHPEDYLPVSGKAMAYTGLGAPDADGLRDCEDVFVAHGRRLNRRGSAEWSQAVVARMSRRGCSDADMIATMQEFLGQSLVSALAEYAAGPGGPPEPLPLAFAGGCALNIKWNAMLRASGLFSDVWVPPFPNDSGSAIGAACAALAADGGSLALEWDVFSGVQLGPNVAAPAGWTEQPATIEAVADLLYRTGEPVAVLSGRAELGPRALGHRSIVAPAVDAGMRTHLNDIKGREQYRPVAPICLEELAPTVFDPGCPDRYMLFDHSIRAEWRERIPAVAHVDGSARLQTVDGEANPLIARLLQAYHAISGIPVLCNTSANFSGCGFFPDAASALRWGRTRYVWSEGTLYSRLDG